MTVLRQTIIEELERVPEEKLPIVMRFIDKLTKETETKKKVWDLDQFIILPTKRGQNADIYVRELRDNDRL